MKAFEYQETYIYTHITKLISFMSTIFQFINTKSRSIFQLFIDAIYSYPLSQIYLHLISTIFNVKITLIGL